MTQLTFAASELRINRALGLINVLGFDFGMCSWYEQMLVTGHAWV